MKKELSLLVFLLLFPLIFAVDITLSKESYQPQETIQAEITGNFISLAEDNILIYQEGKVHDEPIIKGLTKQNNIYYFYAVAPRQKGNYSLVIENAKYLDRGEVMSQRIEKSFILEEKNSSDLSFFPGFIIPSGDFSIKVKSLYKNTDVTAVFEATGETKELDLVEFAEETITFNLPELPSQKTSVILQNYQIPVFLLKKNNLTLSDEKIEFIPYELTGTLVQEKSYLFKVIVKNIGQNNLTNMTFSSNLEFSVEPQKLDLKKDEIKIINVTISIPSINASEISGSIRAYTLKNSFDLPVYFLITLNQSKVNGSNIIGIKNRTGYACAEIGKQCGQLTCNGETVASTDGPCCIGDCLEEKSSNYSNIIGIILIIALILIIAYIILKYMKKRKLKSPEEILKQRSDNYQKRMKPGEEVSGKLDRV